MLKNIKNMKNMKRNELNIQGMEIYIKISINKKLSKVAKINNPTLIILKS